MLSRSQVLARLRYARNAPQEHPRGQPVAWRARPPRRRRRRHGASADRISSRNDLAPLEPQNAGAASLRRARRSPSVALPTCKKWQRVFIYLGWSLLHLRLRHRSARGMGGTEQDFAASARTIDLIAIPAVASLGETPFVLLIDFGAALREVASVPELQSPFLSFFFLKAPEPFPCSGSGCSDAPRHRAVSAPGCMPRAMQVSLCRFRGRLDCLPAC